eukprot:TRINITY_DN6550_c0_g4_i5.p1 TRINITY_DN6550_c0_g4~~TRINITY_DN6550_c0_g4_i5.p1  ORF type:complete len:252 (+),score=53.76 TRINITY_DN6550_c0_g4_i5:75-758(+)
MGIIAPDIHLKKMDMIKRGALIVFEGIDRSGKSTQVKLLESYIKGLGRPVHRMSFPDRTTRIGQEISNFLGNRTNMASEVIHLLYSANRWELRDFIVEELMKGTTIVLDRYAYSGVAYSAAKGLNLDWCKGCDVGLPEPDLVFFIDTKPEQVAKRSDFGEERYEKLDFQKKVYDVYSKLRELEEWTILDGSQSPEDLSLKVQDAYNKTKSENGLISAPVGELWRREN